MKNILRIISFHANATQNQNEILPHTREDDYNLKDK